jgi:hypothetical protein
VLADFREALSSIMGRLSEDDPEDDVDVDQEPDWFMFHRNEVNWSRKPGPRPYLRLVVAEDTGRTTIYPRSSSKGDSPGENQRPDRPFPEAVMHRAHAHSGKKCGLNKDATVIACEPLNVGSYLFRAGRERACIESDRTWIRLFMRALGDLGSGSDSAEGSRS